MPRTRHLILRLLLAALIGGPALAGAPEAWSGPVFDPALPAAVTATLAPTGHLLVRPLVDGRDIGAFILDTGASVHLIDPEAVALLDLRRSRPRLSQDIGGRTVRSAVWRAVELQLGPVKWENPEFFEHDLAYLSRNLGVKVAGILGHDLFSDAVAELDLGAGALSLHDPATFELLSGEWQSMRLVDGIPQLRAQFEDHEGWFAVDTGAAADTVTFHSPTVRRLDLLDDRRTRSKQIAGASGPMDLRSGRLTWFELSGHRFERPRASFATSRRGPLASRSAYGTIGGDFLAPFLLVFDYQNRRAVLAPKPG
ncbi:MAG: aspartyl protease family protein [Planctomycetes bacterium]|nr:aspartyl protease family protein [Planctomycetota bacterium]MBL7009035.1 aspartyl protease family protein [Planctomycetota bacterium]